MKVQQTINDVSLLNVNRLIFLPLKMALPTVNRALRFMGLGSTLFIDEQDIAPLPANEILVKVHAASINPCDIQLWRNGLVAVVAGNKGMGKDFSGTVVAVGENVKGWTTGDQIFGLLFHIVSTLFTE